MLPAAISCSSGFQICVRDAVDERDRRLAPRLPSLLPSVVASSRPPAPPPTTTMWCRLGLGTTISWGGRRLSLSALLRSIKNGPNDDRSTYQCINSAADISARRFFHVGDDLLRDRLDVLLGQRLEPRAATSPRWRATSCPQPASAPPSNTSKTVTPEIKCLVRARRGLDDVARRNILADDEGEVAPHGQQIRVRQCRPWRALLLLPAAAHRETLRRLRQAPATSRASQELQGAPRRSRRAPAWAQAAACPSGRGDTSRRIARDLRLGRVDAERRQHGDCIRLGVEHGHGFRRAVPVTSAPCTTRRAGTHAGDARGIDRAGSSPR